MTSTGVGVLRTGDDHAVLPGGLGLIESAIGFREEFSATSVEEGDAELDGDLDGFHAVADDESGRFDGHTDFLREMDCTG